MNQGMSLVGVDQDWIKIAKGLVLLAAVVFEISSKASREKASKMAMKKDKVAEAEEQLKEAEEALKEAETEAQDAFEKAKEATDAQ